jgi:hypothetical protein
MVTGDSPEKLPNIIDDEVTREKNINKFLDGLFEEMKREQDDKKMIEKMGAKELALSETSDEEIPTIAGKNDNYERVISPEKDRDPCSLDDITLSQWSRGEVFHNNKLIKVTTPSYIIFPLGNVIICRIYNYFYNFKTESKQDCWH